MNIIRIDNQVDLSLNNVTSAQNWLLKYKNSITGNRSLMIKSFLVLFVIIVLFMWFYK